jgi:hypothetical protein
LTPAVVLSMQRTAGNRATAALLARGRLGAAELEGTSGPYGSLHGPGLFAHEIVPHAWLRAHGYASERRLPGNWSVLLSRELHYIVGMHQLDSAIRSQEMMAALSLGEVLDLSAEALRTVNFDDETIAQLCADARRFVESLPPPESAGAQRSKAVARAPAATPRTVVTQPRAGKRPRERTHVVGVGETLAQLARRFGISVDELARANRDKLRRWRTPKGERVGFNAGEAITIPAANEPPAPAGAGTGGERGLLEAAGELVDWAASAWSRWLADNGVVPPAQESHAADASPDGNAGPAAPATPEAAADATPVDVIKKHNELGTFGQAVTVNSTKRDGGKQLSILRSYCRLWKTQVSAYADATPWLKGSLDWVAFEKAGLADEAVWLPFFFALYHGGGGPGVKSDERTLPLVAAPAQTTWVDRLGKTRTANASPHIRGKAMDVDAADLKALESALRSKIPEFSATGKFPIKSLQPETTAGQTAVHINFKNVVFP